MLKSSDEIKFKLGHTLRPTFQQLLKIVDKLNEIESISNHWVVDDGSAHEKLSKLNLNQYYALMRLLDGKHYLQVNGRLAELKFKRKINKEDSQQAPF